MTRRAQLVLVSAAVIAVALVPLLVSFMQLGYQADVRRGGAYDRPATEARHALARAVHDASSGVPGTYRWASREAAVETVRDRLAPEIRTVETARVEAGIATNVTYNRSLAVRRASDCPSGPDRQFGPCVAIDGVVVQDRAGWTHVLAVALDVHTTRPDGETELATVLERE